MLYLNILTSPQVMSVLLSYSTYTFSQQIWIKMDFCVRRNMVRFAQDYDHRRLPLILQCEGGPGVTTITITTNTMAKKQVETTATRLFGFLEDVY